MSSSAVYSTATTIPPVTTTNKITSFLPFTTSYTFPASCSTKYRLDGPSLMAFDPAYGIDVETGVDCGPPIMTTWWEYGLISETGSYKTQRSIGPFTCPVGWTTVASSTKDSSTTATMCCPSDYYLVADTQGSIIGRCLSDVTSGMVLTYGSTSDDSDSFTMATTTLTTSSTVGAIDFWGWNVEYVITSATPTATSASTTSTSSFTSLSTSTTTTATAPSTSSASSDNSGSNSGSGLTAGAKTGIGVGVGVGAIGVIALIAALWIFLRRGKRQQPTDPPITQSMQSMYSPRELHGSAMLPNELDSSHSSSGRVARAPVEIG